MSEHNVCGTAWIDAFLRRRDPARTVVEAEFVRRNCPRAEFSRVLDAPCGLGRHSNLLATMGYGVTGVDRDVCLVAEARLGAQPGATFVVGDLQHLARVPGEFHAAICLWHSFGWFDDAGNDAVLRGFARKLRPGGRLVLDVFHRGFFARHQARREIDVAGRRIVEERKLSGKREIVTLTYEGAAEPDIFDWRLFTPEELIVTARAAGFMCLSTCSRFDEKTPASDAEPSMQLVFEKMAVDPAPAGRSQD